jgi:hypothetical protein
MSSSSAVSSPPAEGLTSRTQPSTKTGKEEKTEKRDETEDKSLDFAHSFPIHTKASASILSKENTDSLSFRGFGNLACMLVYLSILTVVLVMVFGNLRLMVENYVKVSRSWSLLIIVWVFATGSTLGSAGRRLPDKFTLIHIDSCTFICIPLDRNMGFTQSTESQILQRKCKTTTAKGILGINSICTHCQYRHLSWCHKCRCLHKGVSSSTGNDM